MGVGSGVDVGVASRVVVGVGAEPGVGLGSDSDCSTPHPATNRTSKAVNTQILISLVLGSFFATST